MAQVRVQGTYTGLTDGNGFNVTLLYDGYISDTDGSGTITFRNTLYSTVNNFSTWNIDSWIKINGTNVVSDSSQKTLAKNSNLILNQYIWTSPGYTGTSYPALVVQSFADATTNATYVPANDYAPNRTNYPSGIQIAGFPTVTPPVTTYSITYANNSATSGSVPTDGPLAASSTVTVKGNTGTLAKTGYVWNGWTYSGDGSIKYAGATLSMPANAITFTANWTANTYTINYNGNNGSITASGSTAASQVSYPSTSINTASNGFTVPTGYSFGGWSTTQDNTLDYAANSLYSSSLGLASGSSAVTLHAVWNLNSYTVTFDPNLGTVTPTSKTVTYNTAYGTLPTPTRTNYTFNGWFTALTGGTQVTSLTTYSSTSNTTVYAQWTLSTVTPVFTDIIVSSPATLNVAYTDGVLATNATSYSIASGALPTGLSLNTSTGAITGTPIVQGTYTFAIRATSSTSTSVDTSTLTIIVSPPGTRPSTSTRLTTAKRFIGIGASTTNAQGTTISADANGYVNLSRMMVYKAGVWTHISNI